MSKLRRFSAITFLIAVSAVVGGGFVSTRALGDGGDAGRAEALETARDLGDAFSAVAEQAVPAVVFISTEHVEEIATHSDGFPPGMEFSPFPFDDPMLRRFFGRPDTSPSVPRRRHRSGQGSGFLVDAEGTILTNSHVVHGAESVTVRLHDGREFDGRVVGTDPQSDVAVLDIDGDDLPHLQFGDSERLRVGEWVLAVGNPFGLTETVTHGIVSATGRNRVGVADYEDFIQTDAAINPGNSGGPLLDLDGRVIGMNTAIVSRNGGNMGIGFAIPAELVRNIQERLVSDGRVPRGFLGVYLQDLTPDIAKSFGVEGNGGAVVSDVMEDTPAAEAGLEDGDLILRIDGDTVAGSAELRNEVALRKPGSELTLRIRRGDEELDVAVTLAERGESAGGVGSTEQLEELGLTIGPHSAGAAGEGAETGVAVTAVQVGSIADLAGIVAGNVITHLGRTPVATVAELRDALESVDDGEAIVLRVADGESARYVSLRVR